MLLYRIEHLSTHRLGEHSRPGPGPRHDCTGSVRAELPNGVHEHVNWPCVFDFRTLFGQDSGDHVRGQRYDKNFTKFSLFFYQVHLCTKSTIPEPGQS